MIIILEDRVIKYGVKMYRKKIKPMWTQNNERLDVKMKE